ncbi:MAG TPA: glycoside hydrolase family 3 N-terminal domain-containing protein [Solirubrobacteraceae bacterium]|nr:glycoside hydrolase family 3 N-terminal domain-containing protein [Solirubrobacteraceae bacterium]
MLRRLAYVAAVLVAAVAAVAAVRSTASRAGPAIAQPHVAAPSHVRPLIQRLSIEQLAGQRIVYAYAGLKPPASLLAIIRAGEAGGVIFFAPNIANARQLRGVVGDLQRASLASPLHTRLLMLTDQEGGEVRRLPGAPIRSEKQIGEADDDVAAAGNAGAGAGRTLRGAGINVNLAPVLDVYRQPGNFIDEFQRSYSSSPKAVGILGAAFIGAQQRLGVAATAKHFPGLGSASRRQDTDLGQVTLRASLSTLRAVDEAPYANAIGAGVKLVMTSWAVYPALDPRLPAGLSPAVIQGELRGHLGFGGVTITDGLEAGALAPYGSIGNRAVLAASAGADLILCATTNPDDNTPALGTAARNAIATALAHGRLARGSAQQSASRIMALRDNP